MRDAATRRDWTMWVPTGGIAAFVALYFCAAALYPGGTRADHGTLGYSHFANYWCDLLDGVSYSGQVNSGQPLAVLATLLLPISLLPFWIHLPALFRTRLWTGRVVRTAGPGAMLFAGLVFTRLHDLVINVASVLGFAAFFASMLGLIHARRVRLVTFGVLALVFALANYTMWQTGKLLALMPMVQKGAYLSLFAWIVVTSGEVRRERRGA